MPLHLMEWAGTACGRPADDTRLRLTFHRRWVTCPDCLTTTRDKASRLVCCPACGDPIDYCPSGHCAIGNPDMLAVLRAHGLGDHRRCHGDCYPRP